MLCNTILPSSQVINVVIETVVKRSELTPVLIVFTVSVGRLGRISPHKHILLLPLCFPKILNTCPFSPRLYADQA